MGRYPAPLCLLVLLTALPAAAGEQVDMLAAAAIETERLGAAVPEHVVLQDTAGRQVAIGDLLGRRPVLLAPVDCGCKNICGVTLTGLLLLKEGSDRLVWGTDCPHAGEMAHNTNRMVV